MPRRLDIKLLGPVRVELDGAPLVVDTRKAIALLAYLAVSRRPMSREAVAALLWPESADGDARGALRRTLSVLHTAVGGVGLVVDRRTIELRPDADVDLWRFQAALARVRAHDHAGANACPACLSQLDKAVALDRGEFMAGFALRSCETFDEWHAAETEAHRRELTGVLERLARGRAASAAWDAAVAAIRRWLDLDPLHEPAHRLLMAVLAGSGEPAAALRQYRECVRVLDRELGVAPLAETTALAEAIRDGRVVPPLGRASDPLAAPVAASREATPLTVPGARSPLVGRADELSVLMGGFEAPGPDGRLLVVEGEAGIGKTRLGVALAEGAQARGATVLAVEVHGGETSIAFGPVGELIRTGLRRPDVATRLRAVHMDRLREVARLVPLPGVRPAPTPTALEDPFGRVRLFDAITDVLGALVEGLPRGLLWVDDLHRADASTIELMAYLARRLRGRPIAVLITWRPEEMAPGARERILGGAERDALVSCVDLRRLDEAQVAALATTLGRALDESEAHALFERSEGLPLYVTEAIASPAEAVGRMPGGVVALLEARIDGTSEVARQILSAAAVIGRSFDLGSVSAASGRTMEETVDGLDELGRRRLICETGLSDLGDVRYDFTHGRLRDVAYDRLSLARRRLLHGRVAEAIERAAVPASSNGRWSLIAHHETLAGRTSKAAEAHRQAGDQARSVFANAEAREHMEAALALGHPAVLELHEALGDVDMLLGDYDEALAHLETASGLAGPERSVRLDHRLAAVLARRGDLGRADRYLVAVLAALDPDGDPLTRAEILVERGAIAQRQGDHERAAWFAQEALSVGERTGDPTTIARAADLLGIVARSRGDLAAARQLLERAVGAADLAESRAPAGAAATADPGIRVAALNTLALVYAAAGDRDRAIALTREALVGCERHGDRHRQAALENNLADLLHADGRADEAMEHLKRAVAIFAEIGGPPGKLRPDVWKLVEW